MKENWLASAFTNPNWQPWLVFCVLATLNIGLWIVVMTTFPRDVPAAVLHYSVGVGIDFIGGGSQIVVLPAVSTVLLVLNALLALALRRINVAAVWILVGGAAVVQVLLVAAYFFILALN